MRVRRGEGRKETVIIEKSGRIKYVDVNQLVVTASMKYLAGLQLKIHQVCLDLAMVVFQ